MAPVPIRFVVSFSSQDPKHPVQNLLKNDDMKRWLSAPDDKTGHIEALFQLERVCKISHIDVGSFGCFTVQVLVGRSSWPESKPYRTLLPATTFMLPTECRAWKNKNKAKMFSCEEHFDKEVCQHSWDRVRVVCSQPFKKDAQYGLSFLKIRTSTEDTSPRQDKLAKEPFSTTSPPQHKTSAYSGKQQKYTAPSWKSASQIQKHFFGDEKRNAHEEELKSRLLKISSTSESGTDQSSSLSRTAKLVLAAAGQSPRYVVRNPIIPAVLQNGNKKQKLTFADEVQIFLVAIQVENMDMDKVTFADLRHRLEKQKCRKLSKDEKKEFFAIVKKYIEDNLGADEGISSVNNNSITDCKSSNSSTSPVENRTKQPISNKTKLNNDTPVIKKTNSGKTPSQEQKAKIQVKRKLETNTPAQGSPVPAKKPRVHANSQQAQKSPYTKLQSPPAKAKYSETECPLCQVLFPLDQIEMHAAVCCGSDPREGSTNRCGGNIQSTDFIECPTCGDLFTAVDIEEHADICAGL